jgi:hypothetical protein
MTEWVHTAIPCCASFAGCHFVSCLNKMTSKEEVHMVPAILAHQICEIVLAMHDLPVDDVANLLLSCPASAQVRRERQNVQLRWCMSRNYPTTSSTTITTTTTNTTNTTRSQHAALRASMLLPRALAAFLGALGAFPKSVEIGNPTNSLIHDCHSRRGRVLCYCYCY